MPAEIFRELNINHIAVKNRFVELMAEETVQTKKGYQRSDTQILDNFGRDLTKLSREGKNSYPAVFLQVMRPFPSQ